MNIAKYIMLTRCAMNPSRKFGVERHTTGREVANKLITCNLPGLPILSNKHSEVVGIVTEFNILGALREGMDADKFTAERVMTGGPITADINTSAEELIEIMLENNFTMIPITKNNKFAGVVDRGSLLEFFMSPVFERYGYKEK